MKCRIVAIDEICIFYDCSCDTFPHYVVYMAHLQFSVVDGWFTCSHIDSMSQPVGGYM